MEEEAHELGADGVVAVRLTVKHMSWNSDIAEFVAIGTAVRHTDNDGNFAEGGDGVKILQWSPCKWGTIFYDAHGASASGSST